MHLLTRFLIVLVHNINSAILTGIQFHADREHGGLQFERIGG
jgi:hypothetical protein